MVERYGIATLAEGVGGLLSLLEAGITQEPRGEWLEGTEITGLSDGNARYLGSPIATWRFGYIRPESRDALRVYCPGASEELYVQTINNEEEFAIYRAILHWPEERPRDGFDRAVKWDFAPWFLILESAELAPDALALSVADPLDGATGVAVSKTCTLTFNNALILSMPDHVVLLKASDGVEKASAITLDATQKIITVDPTTNMEAATDYILVYTVTDIYGQTLKGAVNFTTA